MENNQYWNIYGKKYDLTKFIKNHPGGSHILESTRNQQDITPLFESYHAFSDIENIKSILNKYLIVDSVEPYDTFDFTKYRELLELVKSKFPTTRSIKAPITWCIFTSVVFITYISIVYSLIVYRTIYNKIPLVICCALEESIILFNCMHDGSHYAISVNPLINNAISKIANSVILWNSNIWNLHHIIQHHSITGLHHDPDSILYSIDIFKHPIFVFVFYTLFPGQQFGQCIGYSVGVFTKNNPFINGYYDYIDLSIIFTKIYFLYSIGISYTILFLMITNILYFINIYPNHELYETKIQNHYTGKDWVKLQICNSGNFLNNNMLWTRIFGGINHQIEHHLFPSMSNAHYPEISHIVRKYCNDNNIPYVHKDTLYSAYESFVKTLNWRNKED